MLRYSYTLLAPFYDFLLSRATRSPRRKSLEALPAGQHILLPGIGTGLDVPWLPTDRHYVGLDLTRAMLARIRPKNLTLTLIQGDAMRLPFADESFDHVVLHLIVAVVPHPALALAEAARVLRPGGTLRIFDKFLQPGKSAPLRRLANMLMSHVATRLDVVFEDLLPEVPGLQVESNQAAALGGWFRMIILRKPGPENGTAGS